MKNLLITIILLISQNLFSQVFTKADEIPSFPGCETILNNEQKCLCNQSQLLILNQSNGESVRVKLTIDGFGNVIDWKLNDIDEISLITKVDEIISDIKQNIKLNPARINGRAVNFEMVITLYL